MSLSKETCESTAQHNYDKQTFRISYLFILLHSSTTSLLPNSPTTTSLLPHSEFLSFFVFHRRTLWMATTIQMVAHLRMMFLVMRASISAVAIIHPSLALIRLVISVVLMHIRHSFESR
jgi:hypothetical protein